MATQRKTYSSKRKQVPSDRLFINYARDRSDPVEQYEDRTGHPSDNDLNNYFSKFTADQLTSDERAKIQLHVDSCSECAAIGKELQEDDEFLEQLMASRPTPEDEVNTLRSINVFRAGLRNKDNKESESITSENTEKPKRPVFVVGAGAVSSADLDMVELIPELTEAVTQREIPRALAIVDRNINQLETVPLLQLGAIHLLAYCAWAVDYYEPYFDPVRDAVVRFRQIPRKELTLSDLALLNIAEGLVKFHQEQFSDAEILFREAQSDADRSEDAELMTITRYYRGRVFSKLRLYDQSLEYIRDAISRDLAHKNHARVAAMELVEGWLLFLKGDIQPAQRVVDRARARLGSRSDAWIDLGNILSFQGRLYREAGPDYYLKALDCFSEAVQLYGKHDPGHRNVARARINSALVYRLIARDLADQPRSQKSRTQLAANIEELRRKAFAEIKQACAIYTFAQSRHRGALSRLHSVRALLYFDSADFQQAEAAAEEAFVCASERGDNLGMANARIIQSKLALEGANGYIDAPAALRLAREAISYAKQTENRRVLARAYLREGHAILELRGKDPLSAKQSLVKAGRCLVPEDRDYLRGALSRLSKSIEVAHQVKRRSDSFVTYTTVERMRQDIEAGYSLAEISEAHDERVARYVCAELCAGNITRAATLLQTGARKVRKAVSFFAITEATLQHLSEEGVVGDEVLAKLTKLKDRRIQGLARFIRLLRKTLESDWTHGVELVIVACVRRSGEALPKKSDD